MRGIASRPVHDVAHEGELRAQLAAGVQIPEIARGEALGFEQRHRQRVAERKLHGRRSGRRETVRAGFLRDGQAQADVRLAAERAVALRSQRDERDAEALGVGDDRGELHALARPGQGDHHVAALQHAEVAVTGFGGMHERGGLASGGERRRHLARDVARLADAGDDRPPGRGEEDRNR